MKFPQYGGRGIKVCARWKKFANFLEDVGPRPSKEHSIDRIDTLGNYEPGNCKWSTRDEQARNRRDSVFVNYQGKRMLLLDVVKELGLSRGIVYGRLKLGWPLETALAMPVRAKRDQARVLGEK